MTLGLDRSRWVVRPLEVAPLVLLLATAAFYQMMLKPETDRLAKLEQLRDQRAATSRFVPVNHGAKDTAEKLAAFYAFFDRDMTYAQWLGRFYDIAARAGIEVRQADYRRIPRADVPLVQYEVALPVSGDYMKIRAFAEGVLVAIPIVSLDHISMKRKQPDQAVVDADLKFTFYIPAPGATK